MLTFHAITIPPLINAMKNISVILKKAQASDIDENTLLTSRIHPTMFPFPKQIYYITQVHDLPARLNPTLPAFTLPDLPRNPTFDDCLTRIAKTIAYLESIAPEDLNGREGDAVKLRVSRKALGDVACIDYDTALEYVTMYSHPNFWFHVVTTYDLLRGCGVEIGKIDFLNAAGLKQITLEKSE